MRVLNILQSEAMKVLDKTKEDKGIIVLPCGCLARDSIINVHRKVNNLPKSSGKGFKISIENLYHAMQGRKNPKSGKIWCLSRDTYVRSFNGEIIKLNRIKGVSYSGKKKVYLLKLENGLSIKATREHKFMTRDDSWVELHNLKDKYVMCDTLNSKSLNRKRIKLGDIRLSVGKNHPFNRNDVVEVHRLIYEARMNNLKFLEYLDILLNEPKKSKKLKYINPKTHLVHHKDECHYNNSIENLELMKCDKHYLKHNNYTNFSQGVPKFSKVLSIEYVGEEDTYDIECEHPHHNFVANGMVVHNSGKTWLSAHWFKQKLEENPGAKLLFVCHNNDILSRANENEFQKCLKEFDIKYSYYNGTSKVISQVTFATVQTLVRNLRKFSHSFFDYMIVDETHHFVAQSFRKAVLHFKPKFMLCLTATPNRTDGIDLTSVCGKILYNSKIREGIANKILCPFQYFYVENDIDFSNIVRDANNRGKYVLQDLNRKICIPEYDSAILNEYLSKKKQFNRTKTICFCATIEHAFRLEKVFREKGIKSIAYVGRSLSKTNKIYKKNTRDAKKNRKIVEQFRNGDYEIIFVVNLFNEGIDVPDADYIIMLRPTLSNIIFTQQLGRGLRVAKNKDYLLVSDFTGNCHNCHLDFETLGEMLGFDSKEQIDKIKRERHRNNREFIIHTLGCQVHLTQKKIDIFKKKYHPFASREEIIEIYKKATNNCTKRIVQRELTKIYPNINFFQIQKHFETWQNLVKECNGIYEKVSKEEIIKNFHEMKKKLGRVPIHKEVKYSQTIIKKHFGTWNEFLVKMGETPTHTPTKRTKEELKELYLKIKSEIKKIPSATDLEKYSLHHTLYKKHFGSWNKFKELMGDQKLVPKERIIEQYKEFYKKNGFYPSIRDIRKNGLITDNTIRRLWGSYSNFIEQIGGKVRKYQSAQLPKERIIKDYYAVKKKLGRVPFIYELDSKLPYTFSSAMGRISKQGSYGKFLKNFVSQSDYKQWIRNRKKKDIENGKTLAEAHKPTYSKEIIEKEYIKNYKELGRHLTHNEMHDRKFKSLPCLDIIKSHLKLKTTSKKEIYNHFDKLMKTRDGLNIIDKYNAKEILEKNKQIKRSGEGLKSPITDKMSTGFRTSRSKKEIREKIISKIKDGDVIFILESPQLEAIKEIEKQGKKPSKIIIPNDKEFVKLAEALRSYETDLNIECINTSALQYLADTDEKIDYMWLDYCGAFDYYSKDLKIVLEKFEKLKLILTYNVTDLNRRLTSDYYVKLIKFILDIRKDFEIYEDVSIKYKSHFYNLGFELGVKQ